jgi:hypothetical protein
VAALKSTLVHHPFVGTYDLHNDPVGHTDRCARSETDWALRQAGFQDL